MSYKTIDRYQIKEGLGQGTSGSVFLATDPKMGRDVAIKILQEDFARNPKHRTRFAREAKAIATLSHPNIVDIYDFGGSPDEYLYLVMELIPGPHIGKLSRENVPVPESTLVAIGLELSRALRHAHETGIIHRDLKPDNVFLYRGRLVLADFGIAKAITEDSPLSSHTTGTTEVIGTPGFMAPEQLQGFPLDEKADIFAFGALLYYLATQLLPFDADSPYDLLHTMRETRPTPVNELRPEISERFSKLIQECVACDKEMRPDSMAIIHEKLATNLRHLGGGDSRKHLADFEANPSQYKQDALRKTVSHLIDQLKIAVRDNDAEFARILEQRLTILAPENLEVRRMTDVTRLLSGVPEEKTPELAYATFKQKRRFFSLGIAACVILAGLVWTEFSSDNKPQQSSSQKSIIVAKQTSVLFESSVECRVFIDGQALGTTPSVQESKVSFGKHQLEFINTKGDSIQHELIVTSPKPLSVVVDWKNKQAIINEQ